MRFRRTVLAGATALLLMTCTSCQTELLDADGDGQVTQLEFLSAVFNSVCGDQTEVEEPEAETPDETTPEEPAPDETTPEEATASEVVSESGF